MNLSKELQSFTLEVFDIIGLSQQKAEKTLQRFADLAVVQALASLANKLSQEQNAELEKILNEQASQAAREKAFAGFLQDQFSPDDFSRGVEGAFDQVFSKYLERVFKELEPEKVVQIRQILKKKEA